MWGTEVARGSGHPGFIQFTPRPGATTDLLEGTTRWGDRDHLVQGGHRVSFRSLRTAALAASARLAAAGLRRGGRMLLLARNSPDWVVAFWASQYLGAVVCPGNRWWSAEELSHAVDLVAPSVIVADEESAGRAGPTGGTAVIDIAELGVSGLAVREPGCEPGLGEPGAAPPSSGSAAAEVPMEAAASSREASEDDPALIIFTAGTTGRAKASVLSHRAVIANLHNLLTVSGRLPHLIPPEGSPEVILQSGPMFHIGGVQSILLALVSGNTVVFLGGRFDSGAVLDAMESEGVTVWGAVPTMVERLLEDPTFGRRDLSRVRSVSLGGAPVTPELTRRLRSAFPSLDRGVSTVYGMTEAGGTVASASGSVMKAHPGTSGRPLPTVEVKVDAPDAEDRGEILVRTPSQMSGYWDDELNPIIDSEGWLHTGDIGTLDDGMLYITGRAKDVIIRGGENIAAAHVEEVLGRHPAVVAVAVIGLDGGDLGEIVGAVVQCREQVSTEELGAFALGVLGRFEVPQRWWLVDEALPLTDAGKMDKLRLKQDWLRHLGESTR